MTNRYRSDDKVKYGKLCLVCLEPFGSRRRDAKYCGAACRQKACRDHRQLKNNYELPKWMRYRVIHYKEVFTLKLQAASYKRREWIDSDQNLNRVKENMEKYESVLFICYKRSDILKVAEAIGL